MQTSTDIPRLHKLYCELIGDPDFAYTIPRFWAWEHWLAYPRHFTADDLRMVVALVKRKNWSDWHLKFMNLIERPEDFEQLLSQARAEQRNRRPLPTPKEQVVRALPTLPQGKPSENTAKPVGDLIPRLIAKMREAAR